MSRNRGFVGVWALGLPLLVAPGEARAVAGPESVLHKAYYLEHQQKDFEAAKKLYDQVIDQKAGAEFARVATTGSARCRDALAARNFARLMPEETLVYIELNRPGELVAKLAGMLGLTSKPIGEALAARPNATSPVPFHIPSEFVVSPALLEALSGFGGAAAALTEIDIESGGPPKGVLVVHHGDVALLKGMLETAFQFAPTVEKIRGLPTFGTSVLPEPVVGVLTESLLVVGTGRGHVEGVVERLLGDGKASLASQEGIAELIAESRGATLFACANLRGIVERLRKQLPDEDRGELELADKVADLGSLRWATFSLGIDDGVLGVKCAVRLADDHRNLIYNIMRLPPMSRNALRRVPPEAAAFFGIGLNPALTQAAVQAAGAPNKDAKAISAFDIGREFFGNIQEICAYVVPGGMMEVKIEDESFPLPNVGIVMAVNDPAKSQALWDQLLTVIPGSIAGQGPIAGKPVEVGAAPATAYTIPNWGKVYLAELDGCVAIGLTRAALEAAIRTERKGRSILDDDTMRKVIDRLPEDSTIMAAGHIGRIADVVSGCSDMGVKMTAAQVAPLCRNTIAWFGLGQSPNQISIEAAVTGLPNLNEVFQRFGPIGNAAAGMAMGREDDAPVDSER